MAAKTSRAARTIFVAIGLFVLFLAIAAAWWFTRPHFAGGLRLDRVAFDDLPGWRDSDPRPALIAFRRSCSALASDAPAQAMGGSGYAGQVGDWTDACRTAPQGGSAAEIRKWFETTFVPFSVSAGWSGDGLFTGYYEPELEGSTIRHGRYQTPVYAFPDDLVEVELGDFRDAFRGERIAGRVEDHRLKPYATRAEIDAHGLSHADTLFYGTDAVAVFFLQIQGSGRVRLDDGRTLRVAYAGQNGWPYTPIGRALIEEGAVPREHMSLQAIRDWMTSHPNDARRVMELDKSFVFFKEMPLGDPALGSPGAEGVALTPGASLAVDTKLHALGVPVFVAATAPDPDPAKPEQTFDRLFVAQDMGGAIRGAVRGDVYWGFGANAESIAGRMKSTGKLYVLLPKALADRQSGAHA